MVNKSDNERRNPFSVPDDYFASLEDRIMKRIEEEKRPKRINYVQLLKPYFGMAAIFLIAIFAVKVVAPGFIDSDRMLIKNQGSKTTLGPYEQKNISELNLDFNPTDEEIIEYLAREADVTDILYLSLF